MHASTARSRSVALAGISIASFLGCIDFTIVNTAMPAIQQALDADVQTSQWIVTAFLIGLSTCMVAAGRLADLRGRRRALYAGMVLFAIGSLGAGLAWNVQALIAWRLVQGIACAALYTASTAVVTQMFPEAERGKAIGLLFGANGLGLAIGPVVGGLVVGLLGWRAVFLMNVPLIAIGFLLCRGRVMESRASSAETLDVVGLIVAMLALPCLLLAVVQGADWGWLSLRTTCLAGAGALLLCAFVWTERKARFPLFQFDLFANLRFASAAIASASLAFFYCSAFFLMPMYLSLARGCDSTATGWLLLPTTAVMAIASPLSGRWADRRGTTEPMLAGLVVLMASAALQTQFASTTSWIAVITAFAFMGVGWGCLLGPSTMAAIAAVPPALAGLATGAAWTLHNFAGALGLSLATTVYRAFAGTDPRALGGYSASMWLLVVVCALAFVSVLVVSVVVARSVPPLDGQRRTA
ncbi:MFS transporter [Variovorax sp. dw_954]|uniref:MFS transporter n=1 Tax=Variovorax sp. dw_954 TaxID=2720078 RepID=UPI002116C5EB|nr:MFS transporter [Variovorax sp. dw_954]